MGCLDAHHLKVHANPTPQALVVLDWVASKPKLQAMWSTLDIDRAECQVASDRADILAQIDASRTPAAALNASLRGILQRKLHPGITLKALAAYVERTDT